MTTHSTQRKGSKIVAREAESDLEKVTAIVGKYDGNRFRVWHRGGEHGDERCH